MTRTTTQLGKTIATGLALAAFAVPTASALSFSNAGPTLEQLGQISTDGPRAGGPVGADVNAYSHDGPRSGPATTLPPFSVDGPRTAPIALPLSAPVATGDGFDWADAGIGAGIGIGVSLLALLGVAVARRQRPLARV